MLIYEAEGFLEVEADSIKQLCRSADHVTFSETKGKGFDVHAVLCEFQDDSQSRCYVAFHDKALKKALIFSVKSANDGSAWQHGCETLAGLGYRLEDVNLRLSPAMLEVVLRDVPGLASPAEARRQRDEKAQLLAELQEAVETNPENAAGKKAARKLAAEQSLDERLAELRQFMVDALSPAEGRDADGEALMAQVEDLTARLEAVESRADEERKQREVSESITAAAEKRIQELEEILVEADKKSVGELKQKRRIVALKGRIKELEEQLTLTSDELENERAKQEQFVADVKQAQAQVTTLEESLQKAEKTLAEIHEQLAEEQASKSRMETSCKDAEERIRELEEEIRGLAEQRDQSDEAKDAVVEAQSQLEKLEGELHDLREEQQRERTLRESLEESAAEDGRRVKELEDELEKARALAEPSDQSDEAKDAVVEAQSQLEKLEGELHDLREEQQRERALRESLEESAAEDGRRIKDLEDELEKARALAEPSAQSDEAKDAVVEVQSQLEKLESELHDLREEQQREHALRETLEESAVEDGRRIKELESELEKARDAVSATAAERQAANQEELDDLERRLRDVQAEKESLAGELEQAHKTIDALEQSAADKDTVTSAAEDKKLVELAAVVESLKEQLTQERVRHDEHGAEPADSKETRKKKPLPHELRPAPNKNAFFHPDWDLEGLPCDSEDQVVRAWETVFNVQITLEGYPSQYCMAFLVVLRIKKTKKLFMLFRLKQNKHTLVCVPAATPNNEEQLQTAIDEGLSFLKKSGFEMEEMPKEYIANSLGSYFLGT